MKLEQLIASYADRPVSWGPIGEQVFKRTYSLDLENGKTERWHESIGRSIIGNTGLVDPKHIEEGEQEALMELLFDMGALPAGRHLAASGVPGRQFLNNCLSGDTKVLTRQGFKEIKYLSGDVEILSMNEKTQTGPGCWSYDQIGTWRTAHFKSYGKQGLYRVTLSDGTTIDATADHKWYVTKRSGPVETVKLQGHMIPIVTAPKPEKNESFQTGILNGFVFGDGHWSGHPTHASSVQLCNEYKTEAMEPLFTQAGYCVTRNTEYPRVVGLPGSMKTLPPIDADRSYWYGFVVGLIAADGTVDKNGSVFIYQSDKEALETIRQKAMESGFSCTNILMQREKNPWTGEYAPNWRFAIRRSTIDSSEILLSHHKENLELAGESVSGRSLQVVSVLDLGVEEEVYCCVEPETHTIVISNSILTGQCHGAGWDYQRPWYHFDFTFNQLMQGGGVGTNVSNRYMKNMPRVENRIDCKVICDDGHKDYEDFKDRLYHDIPEGTSTVIRVEDSREGWVEATSVMLKAAWDGMWKLSKYNVPVQLIFDVSDVRPKGAPLKTSGGKAAGPEPLVKCLLKIAAILNQSFDMPLTSIQAMHTDHAIASAVVAGGKRRSSRMVVKSWKDSDIVEFINCKSTQGHHWTTNISVEVDNEFFAAYKEGDFWATMVMRTAVKLMLKNGEPGFWNIDKAREGEREPLLMFCPNPCGEINFQMFENCNLGHVNLRYWAMRPLSQCKEAFRLITRWLIRATFGDVTSPQQREVMDRNRRIGVGFFGFHGWLAMNGIRYSDAPENIWVQERLEMFRSVVVTEGTKYAKEIGINVPVKFTTLAPTGTIVCLCGDTSSAQCDFCKWGKRLVRYSNNQEELHIKRLEGYPVYPDEDAFNTSIVEYWMESPMVQYVKMAGFDPDEVLEDQEQIHVETSLKMQSMLQRVWSDNAISFTINLPVPNHPKPEDYVDNPERSYDADVQLYEKAMQLKEKEIEGLLIQHLPNLKGTTMFPELSRKNAPLQRVTKAQWDSYTGPKEIMQVEQVCVGGCPVK